ncbi:MAG: hypothetical protein ABEH43_03045, partial [Flavobacteriales bacterium]
MMKKLLPIAFFTILCISCKTKLSDEQKRFIEEAPEEVKMEKVGDNDTVKWELSGKNLDFKSNG